MVRDTKITRAQASKNITLDIYGHITKQMKKKNADRMENVRETLVKSIEKSPQSLAALRAFYGGDTRI